MYVYHLLMLSYIYVMTQTWNEGNFRDTLSFALCLSIMFERNWDPWLVSFALTCWASFASAFENCDGPTKIFLLAGQSNMVGMGSIEHMRKLLNDTETHEEYATYWNETSHDWAERDDIFVKFNDHIGYLRVGFGAAEDDGFFWPELVLDGHFGPELGMGWVLGDQMQNCGRRPIFFLKTAYGGRDLAIDFRPPSSGKGNYEGVKPVHYGWQYREMIDDILSTLADLENLVPGYDDDLGFELSGLVWFQGPSHPSRDSILAAHTHRATRYRLERHDLGAKSRRVRV
jgi:Carbohydrate esterase, sialic acid-specific acetylesterase